MSLTRAERTEIDNEKGRQRERERERERETQREGERQTYRQRQSNRETETCLQAEWQMNIYRRNTETGMQRDIDRQTEIEV